MTLQALEKFRSGARVTGIGLMSGTSADGIDAALVDLWDEDGRVRIQPRTFHGDEYPADVRAAIFDCFHDRATCSQICHLNAVLGRLFADTAARTLAMANLQGEQLDFVASHGQTIWHEPAEKELGEVTTRATLQIGEAACIAELLRVPVVSDFRQQDLAAEGQGAPLVPYLDHLLLAHPTENRAVQNLGGIGNVTYLPAGAGPEAIIAFDTGPANALIDEATLLVSEGTRHFDTGGYLAAGGPANERLLERLMQEPYLQLPPPKSTGRELFSAAKVRALWEEGYRGTELVSTLTQFTVETIADAYRRWLGPVDRVILAGGGVRNPEIVRRLRAELDPIPIQGMDEFGISGDMKEAVAFAVLGYQTLRGLPSNVPAATGATRPVVQGKITLP